MSSQPSPNPHPYLAYEGTAEWSAIDRAMQQLAANRDLVETTAHEYIVGYLCKALKEPATAEPATPQGRQEALQRIRAAVKKANPAGRDLVAELIAERRLEAQRD
jgi:hypothetical protein